MKHYFSLFTIFCVLALFSLLLISCPIPDDPVDNPVDAPIDNPVDDPIDNPVDAPIDNPVDDPILIPVACEVPGSAAMNRVLAQQQSTPLILINEVDADNSGTDTMEFVELYDGGTGGSSLTGLVLVAFNGSIDKSYAAWDLDGKSTDSNGFFVLGNDAVSEADLQIGASGKIQNGADALVLFQGDATSFPNNTLLTAIDTDTIIDAVVYDTSDDDDAELLALLVAGQPQIDENSNSNGTSESSQRCDREAKKTESFIQAAPTPGAANSCGNEPADPMTPTPDPPTPTPAPLKLISAIQGTDNAGLLVGDRVMVEAIVVGDFQDNDADEKRNLRGFYLQEETTEEDGDPQSSEGIFVYDNAGAVNVELGDRVRVVGTVNLRFDNTQISSESVEVLETPGAETGLARVTQACIDLSKITEVTQDEDNNYQPDLEPYENMYVMIGGEAHIIEQYQLARFNEIRLAVGDRPVQFTQINTPNAAAYELYRKSVGARSIVYDDGLNEQNAPISNLDGFANYAEAAAPRMGDTVTDLQGVLDYQWAGNAVSPATWRVRSHRDGTNTFTRTNPRPGSAPQIAGNVRIASFNVLNYFTTLDASGVTTAQGGDPRGADNAAELTRQQAKLVNAIVDMHADVFGLVELENEFDENRNGSTAIAVLVRAVNTALQNDGKADRYDYVYPGQQFVGDDVIAVALIYNTAKIELAAGASPAILNDAEAAKLTAFQSHPFATDPVFTGDATNRAALAMTFAHTATGRFFTVSVNHFKSKGSSGLSTSSDPNYDAQDGAGFWNARRLKAAEIVTAWLDTDPNGVAGSLTVLLGDINAYAKEEPIQYITNNGYRNFEDAGAYSYVFDGYIGTLDYGFYKIEESGHVSFAGSAVWHINADEASALDYNTDYGRLTSYFDADTAIRSSDHDPLIGGFTFK